MSELFFKIIRVFPTRIRLFLSFQAMSFVCILKPEEGRALIDYAISGYEVARNKVVVESLFQKGSK